MFPNLSLERPHFFNVSLNDAANSSVKGELLAARQQRVLRVKLRTVAHHLIDLVHIVANAATPHINCNENSDRLSTCSR